MTADAISIQLFIGHFDKRTGEVCLLLLADTWYTSTIDNTNRDMPVCVLPTAADPANLHRWCEIFGQKDVLIL